MQCFFLVCFVSFYSPATWAGAVEIFTHTLHKHITYGLCSACGTLSCVDGRSWIRRQRGSFKDIDACALYLKACGGLTPMPPLLPKPPSVEDKQASLDRLMKRGNDETDKEQQRAKGQYLIKSLATFHIGQHNNGAEMIFPPRFLPFLRNAKAFCLWDRARRAECCAIFPVMMGNQIHT